MDTNPVLKRRQTPLCFLPASQGQRSLGSPRTSSPVAVLPSLQVCSLGPCTRTTVMPVHCRLPGPGLLQIRISAARETCRCHLAGDSQAPWTWRAAVPTRAPVTPPGTQSEDGGPCGPAAAGMVLAPAWFHARARFKLQDNELAQPGGWGLARAHAPWGAVRVCAAVCHAPPVHGIKTGRKEDIHPPGPNLLKGFLRATAHGCGRTGESLLGRVTC